MRGAGVEPTWQNQWAQVYIGDALAGLQNLPSNSVQEVITSPPYWGQRSYLPSDHPDKARELGAEPVHSCGILESGFLELRDDLTPEQMLYVITELKKEGLL